MKKNCVLFLLLFITFFDLGAKAHQSVLILNSFHPEFRSTMFEITGIKSSLINNGFTGDIYIEYLDSKNIPYKIMGPMYYDLLKRKYTGVSFKVVLGTDNDALRFLQSYGSELFPEAEFVFCGINGPLDSLNIDRNKYTGVITKFMFDDNINMLLKLFPDTKEIVSFYDTTVSGKLVYKEYINSIKIFKNKGIKFTTIINPSISELLTILARLKRGQVIYQGEFCRDKNGEVFNYSNISELISRVSKVPIWGSENEMINKGIVGGKIFNPYFQGKVAGTLALEILYNKKAKNLKVVENLDGVYFFDYAAYSKFGINSSMLPNSSRILNEPITYWQKNKDLLIKVGIAFLVLLTLIIILLINIVRRKRAEESLYNSKNEIDMILASITDLVWSMDFDKNGKVIKSYYSPVIETITGYKAEYLTKDINRWRGLIFPEDISIVFTTIEKLLKGTVDNNTLIFRIITAGNKIRWVEQSITINKKEDGSIRFNGVTKDISKSREQEETSLRYLKAIEQSPISVIITNTEGLIEYVNPHFEKTSGYTFDEIKDTNPEFFRTDYQNHNLYNEILEIISIGNQWKGEFYNKRKTGEFYWELASVTPIKNDEKEITHYLIVKEDITRIKGVELELIEAKEKAEKADKLKDEFLAQMSHEIRTPINAILSFAGLLKDELEDKIEDDLKTCFAIMTRAGKRIIRTIDLILNMAEMKTGYFQPVFVEIDIDSKISEAIQYDFKQSASDKKLYLNYNYKSKSKTIIADEYTFDEIIKNLVDNAIKYTFTGGIDVNVFDFEDNKLAVEVKDTGIGISDEYIPNLFEPFSQEEQGYTRKFEGNGLGLALIKKYTDLNDAKITVESKKGEGTTFIVYFNKNIH